ncbi:MAG: hypothetical protein CMP73_02105 [Flavobacteriales bacterium]|nr:hypothetical protein [Flavobacteriales bacterium]
MGIINYIFSVFFLIASLSLYSSSYVDQKDTLQFDGKTYVKHIVKGGESLQKIANIHNVQVVDILNSNEMSRRLYYNQVLYIPLNLNNNNKKINFKSKIDTSNQVKKDNINLALLMPYYLVKNDTMFNDFTDTNEIPFIYYKLSETALSFHVGITLALDSLRKKGMSITLHTYDTNKDTLKTMSLVKSGVLDNMDIIIGPLHAHNFEILCRKYGDDKDKTIINPLSRITKAVEKYNSVYQISPSIKDECLILRDKIVKDYKYKRVMIIHHNSEKNISLYLQNLFRKKMKNVELLEIQYTHIDSIRRFFNDYQIVVIPSTKQAFVSKMLASIGGMDSTSIVFGLSKWKNYQNLDVDDMMEIDVHFPVYNIFDKYNLDDQVFLNLFEKKYNTNPGKYTHIAYKIIMHFLTNTKVFEFKNLSSGGKININAPLYHYDNYELIPSN